MAERPKLYVNGKLIGEVIGTVVIAMNGAAEGLARVKEYMWKGLLAQEFGTTDPRIFHDGP
jgi:hypothetical protein